ncbi:MAG: MarR family transcriptional regulator [Sulfuricella sp.]|nr:MarR family transcriptional regulator [Sulfuricella sp.]
MKTVITTGGPDEFFKRGKRVARLADKGEPIPRERTISFEDPEDLARLVTTAKLLLFREVRGRPGSITDLATRLHRDRSAVKRDVAALERIGLLEVEEKPLPGHGRMKEIRVTAEQVLLAI